jgi:hypothetical protein
LAEEFVVRMTDQPDPLGTAKVAQPVDKNLIEPATEGTEMPDGLKGRCVQEQSGEGLLDKILGIGLLEVLAAKPAVEQGLAQANQPQPGFVVGGVAGCVQPGPHGQISFVGVWSALS